MTPDGNLIDSKAGMLLRLDTAIAGFAQGLMKMREGGYYRLFIPPEMAYGETGIGSTIKPNTALIYDVVLESIGK